MPRPHLFDYRGAVALFTVPADSAMPQKKLTMSKIPKAIKDSPPPTGAHRFSKGPVSPGVVHADKDGAGLTMPHERDESEGDTAIEPNPVIAQAKRDLDAGMVDTDMRITPGLDASAREKMVAKPPRSSS